VVRGRQVLFRAHHGLANLETKAPVGEGTIFHWASVTKTFTAIAFMQLRDRGLVGLDDPAIKYVPELKEVHDPFGDPGEITLRQLLSHSAGFRNPTWPWGGDQDWHPFEPRRWEQLAAMMPYTEILFRPGSKYSYSNPGLIFIGRTIEALTTDDYEVYVDKNVLKPLGMHRSYFDVTPYHLRADKARGYNREDDRLTPGRAETDSGITVSNSGLNAPLEDMARYLAFLAGDADEPARSVLARATLHEMWRPVVEVSRGRVHEDMGLSFFIEERGGRTFVGHYGEQNGFYSHFYLEPATGLAYIVAYNTLASSTATPAGFGDTAAFDRALAEYVFDQVFPRLAPVAKPKPAGP
jgi:CubicO group peptidase (beta-lactamase class C family)